MSQSYTYPSTVSVTATNPSVSSTGSAVPASATYIAGKNAGNLIGLAVDSSGNLASLPLPTGSATSALQTTGNTSVASIDTKTPALGQALAASSVPVVLTAIQLAALTPLTTVTVAQATGTNLHTVVDSSALPTGASTSALQTTGNTSLASIDGKLPTTLGQKTAAASLAVVLASNQTSIPVTSGANVNGSNTDSTVSTVATLTPPSNSVGFILMNLDTSTASIRWRIGATATSSAGQQLQAGRDSGYVPCAANISICAESGTQNYNVQWILSV